MKNTAILVILIIGVAAILTAAQDKQIAEIRKIYNETNTKIKDAEKAFALAKKDGGQAETEIYLTELNFNKGNTTYPATGIFHTETKFYFTFGKTGNPYPDRLLKIVQFTHRTASVDLTEWLFNSNGQLIFYFDDFDQESLERDEETRLYFSGGKLIRFQAGEEIIGDHPIFRNKNLIVQESLDRQKKLVNLFKNSL